MNTFYMVFVEGGATPACKHDSLDSAEKEAKRLATLLSNDIRDCTCRNEELTFAQFERERYNKELEKRNSIIKELQSENKYLHKELKRHVTLLSKKK